MSKNTNEIDCSVTLRTISYVLRSSRLYAVVALIFTFSAPNAAWAQERHDGHLWETLSRELKVSYMQGLIDGSVMGAQMVKEGIPQNSSCRDEIMDGYRKTFQKFLAEVSAAQIADGVDTVFKDYRNRSLLITDAVYVALRAIGGMPQEDIEKLLQAVRKAPK
jgi:hypothetical protein